MRASSLAVSAESWVLNVMTPQSYDTHNAQGALCVLPTSGVLVPDPQGWTMELFLLLLWPDHHLPLILGSVLPWAYSLDWFPVQKPNLGG